MSPVLCKLCVVERGATLADALDGDDELYEHIEMVHDIPVRREGETYEEAKVRVLTKNPRMGGPGCHCPDCTRGGGLGW